mgnify:CR=1 FL=1
MNTVKITSIDSWQPWFRFLYGRWIRYRFTPKEATMVSSDSSMVDEYLLLSWLLCTRLRFRFLYGRWILELDETDWFYPFRFRFLYGRWIRVWLLQGNYSFFSSDSSMVDEYPASLAPFQAVLLSSDSSMVDEYLAWCGQILQSHRFRFLYGRWIPPGEPYADQVQLVQIPLWSMNTHFPQCLGLSLRMFRFLYGRWIQVSTGIPSSSYPSSDSSMVDEY